MTKVGEHVTFDIIGTQKEYDPKFYEKLVYKIAKKAKVVVLEISKYKFEPQGFTLVALLAESHISFHTFPEKGIISFDFFTCGKVSPSVALKIIKEEIHHTNIIKKEFNRDTTDHYHDNYSSPGLNKAYVVNKVLENFKSKVGQYIEILDLEQFGKALFIDNEIQVAESDEHLYSSTFVNSVIIPLILGATYVFIIYETILYSTDTTLFQLGREVWKTTLFRWCSTEVASGRS